MTASGLMTVDVSGAPAPRPPLDVAAWLLVQVSEDARAGSYGGDAVVLPYRPTTG